MAFPQGIAFRATAGFVTDGANDDAEIGTTANYPRTTAQGNSVGWEQAPGGTRDRNSGVDSRLAGIAFISSSGTACNFRIDPPSTGDYVIRLAAGDASFSAVPEVELFDGTTSLGVIGGSSTGGAGRFFDASNVIRTSAADWVANNAAITKTFATTIFRARLNQTVGTNTLAYLYIESAGGGVTTATLTGASTVPAFTSSGALKALAKITGASSVAAFASTAAAALRAKLTGDSTVGDFASSGALVTLFARTLTGESTVGAFTSAAAARARVALTGASNVGTFTSQAAAAVRAKLTGASTVPAFTSAAAAAVRLKLTGDKTIGNFASHGVLKDPNAETPAGSIWPAIRRRR